tara:strand:- start:3136 stop:3642 length:507 start_codon:yes stop_codon:yes gene_type:complete
MTTSTDERIAELAQKLYSEEGHSGNIYKKASSEMLRLYEWKAQRIIEVVDGYMWRVDEQGKTYCAGKMIELDHSVSPEKYIGMPEGLDGYWWETETQICVADIHSHDPQSFIRFLNVIERKGKPVFFPTLVNARLDRLLRLRGYQDAFVRGKIFGNPEIFDGLAKLPQ